MSRPITWQNVSSPDFGGISAGMSDAFDRIRQGLNGTRNRGIEDRLENRLTTSHAMKMLQGEETLNQQQFDNAHAGEKLAASLASSREYSRATSLQSGKAERMLADRGRARELIQKVPRNEDGSPNLPVLNAGMVELRIHPDAFALEMDASNSNTGFAAKLKQDALLSKRKHDIRVKNAGSSKGAGATKNMDENPTLRRMFTKGGGTPEMEAYIATKIADGHDPVKVRAAAKSGVTGSSLIWGGDEWSYGTSDAALENLEKPKVKAAADALNTGR